MGGRCYAVTGTAMSGPSYCGRPAKAEDRNGRPVCGIHARYPLRTEGIWWAGNRRRYPEGTGGDWRFNHGAAREAGL